MSTPTSNEHPLLALARFGEKCLDAHREEFADLGGDWLQEAAVECGLLKEVEVTEACDPETCRCAEYGDFPQTCYKLTEKAYLIEPPAHETEATRVARSLRDSANGCLENDMVAYTPTALRAIADRIDGGNAQKASEPRMVECGYCHGDGRLRFSGDMHACEKCGGTGQVKEAQAQ